VTESQTSAKAFAALPSSTEVRGVIWLTVIFGLLFAVVYFGADMVSYGANQRWKVAFDFEKELPFIPAFAIAYLSIIPLLLLAPLIFRSTRDLLPLFCTLSLVVITAGICFLLIPIEKSFPPRQADGIFGIFFNLADTINLSFNDLPSLHVALSLTACAAFAGRSNAIGKSLFAIWALLITVSTLFIHEHHILDIGGGVVLAGLALIFVYRPLSRSGAKDRLEVEWLCLSECVTFARRHHRYLLIALIIYQRAIFTRTESRVLRTGFVLLQVIDDYLDGDRKSNEDPQQIAAGIVRQFETGLFKKDPLGRLAAALWQDLDTSANNVAEAKVDVVALIRHMMTDRERIREERVYSGEQLRAHHRLTFKYSMNLLLNAVDSEVRVDSFTELLDAFGWCSTMRDLKEDLENGLINIPLHVIREVRSENVALDHFQQLVATNAIRNWERIELESAWSNLNAAQQKVMEIEDPVARRVIAIFVKSMIGFAEKFEKMRKKNA
jgi:membrane-associated phospholipid phosphatase